MVAEWEADCLQRNENQLRPANGFTWMRSDLRRKRRRDGPPTPDSVLGVQPRPSLVARRNTDRLHRQTTRRQRQRRRKHLPDDVQRHPAPPSSPPAKAVDDPAVGLAALTLSTARIAPRVHAITKGVEVELEGTGSWLGLSAANPERRGRSRSTLVGHWRRPGSYLFFGLDFNSRYAARHGIRMEARI